MFRPNRIGQPFVLSEGATLSTVDWTPNTANWWANDYGANVINASAGLTLSRSALMWNGAAEAIAADKVWALVHQFTVSRPLNGDTVGIEVAASIAIQIPKHVWVTPLFVKLSSPGSSLLEGVLMNRYPTLFPGGFEGQTAGAADGVTVSFKDTIISNANSTGNPGGTYGCGFLFRGGATYNIGGFLMQASNRQLNDQQSVGYQDTRR